MEKKLRPVFVKTTIWVDNPKYDPEATESYGSVEHPFLKRRMTYVTTKTVEKPVEFEGLFHCWGSQVFEGSDNVATGTVAIVEDREGKVYEVDPPNVKFLDRGEDVG